MEDDEDEQEDTEEEEEWRCVVVVAVVCTALSMPPGWLFELLLARRVQGVKQRPGGCVRVGVCCGCLLPAGLL